MGDPSFAGTIFQGASVGDLLGSSNDIVGSDAISASESEVSGLNFSGSGGFSGGGAGSLGGAVSSIFSGIGGIMSAGAYRTAAKEYDTAAAEEGENVKVQEFTMGSKINEIVGSQQAQLGAAGVTSGGSGQYLNKSAIATGGLAQGQIAVSGEIAEDQYEAQAKAANQQAGAATVGGIGSIIGGIIGIAGFIAGF